MPPLPPRVVPQRIADALARLGGLEHIPQELVRHGVAPRNPRDRYLYDVQVTGINRRTGREEVRYRSVTSRTLRVKGYVEDEAFALSEGDYPLYGGDPFEAYDVRLIGVWAR